METFPELENYVDLIVERVNYNWVRADSIDLVIENNSGLQLPIIYEFTIEVYYEDQWREIEKLPDGAKNIGIRVEPYGLRHFNRRIPSSPPIGEGLYRIRKHVVIYRPSQPLIVHEIVAEFHWR